MLGMGDITILARDLVLFDGGFAFSRLEKGGIGRGGDIRIITDGSVRVTGIPIDYAINSNTGQLVTATFGEGDAGNVIITAGKNVSFDGRGSDVFTLVAADQGVGNAGNIMIDSGSLSILNGARLISNTENQGNAGNINITAHDTIRVDGTGSQIATAVTPQKPGAMGNGGTINLNTEALSLTNGASVNANNFSSIAAAGNVEVTAGSIRLDNKATISAVTGAGLGNINLNARDFLLLRRDSMITTNASGAAAGGNITINAPNGFVVATPNENNDITANAFFGSGGEIKINAQGIYNFNQRSLQDLENLLGTNDPTKLDPQQLPTNDITAISLTSPVLSGQVNIITPDIDPSRGLVTLPIVTEVAPKLISSTCAAFADSGGSKFTVTGRSGLPPSPDEPLTSDVVWSDTRLPVTTSQHQHKTHAAKPKPQPIAIIPATGWVLNDLGEITLISSTPNATTLNTPTSCPVR